MFRSCGLCVICLYVPCGYEDSTKRSLRKIQGVFLYEIILIENREQRRRGIPCGCPKKSNREQRAGTRPAPTVHKHSEAVILSKAKNLFISWLRFFTGVQNDIVIGVHTRFKTTKWG